MKIGIVSDTHRNKTLLGDVVDWLEKNQRISMLLHLGDDYDDMVDLSDRYIEILQVPGIYNSQYIDGSLPAVHEENIMGMRIILVHSIDKDLTRAQETGNDIILYGHTHRPEMRLEEGRLYMNPGHLKAEKDKMFEASFGLLEIQDEHVRASIYNLQFKPMESMKLLRSEQGLYKGI